MKVPDILLSGDHKKIQAWRDDQMKMRTMEKRRDLIDRKRFFESTKIVELDDK